MTTSGKTWNHTFLSIQNEMIEIKKGSRNFSLSVKDILSLCLRPKKSNYLSAIAGNILFINDRSYNLCITTIDNTEVTIRIKSQEKQIYVNLIAQVRKTLRKPMA